MKCRICACQQVAATDVSSADLRNCLVAQLYKFRIRALLNLSDDVSQYATLNKIASHRIMVSLPGYHIVSGRSNVASFPLRHIHFGMFLCNLVSARSTISVAYSCTYHIQLPPFLLMRALLLLRPSMLRTRRLPARRL